MKKIADENNAPLAVRSIRAIVSGEIAHPISIMIKTMVVEKLTAFLSLTLSIYLKINGITRPKPLPRIIHPVTNIQKW